MAVAAMVVAGAGATATDATKPARLLVVTVTTGYHHASIGKGGAPDARVIAEIQKQ